MIQNKHSKNDLLKTQVGHFLFNVSIFTIFAYPMIPLLRLWN